jgi:hypothetical protein
MKKEFTAFVVAVALLVCMVGLASASLVTIGTAQFWGTGTAYNLVWDENNNGNSVVWLDYRNPALSWSEQGSWADGLGLSLTYNIYAGYSIDWGMNPWRLPSVGTNPSSGYNKTSSEMGHLFYTELGLDANDTSNEELNASNFDHLSRGYFWSAEHQSGVYKWGFRLTDGNQYPNDSPNHRGYGLAIRNGVVSQVPIPGSVWLLGCGFLSIIGIRRRFVAV